jgi:dTDP-4-amino-4,6-dideoxygalactose transaminase
MNIMDGAGITTRQGTHAVHALDVYTQRFEYRKKDLPNAWLAENLSIALPIFPGMTEEQQSYVIDTLRSAGTQM